MIVSLLFSASIARGANIEGVVTNTNGIPIGNAYVYVYGTDKCTTTDSLGYYILTGISPAAPRYIVCAEKDDYFIARKGDIDVINPVTVNFVLEEFNSTESYKTQVLDVRLGYVIDHKIIEHEPLGPDTTAVLDTTLYPDSIKPYLDSGQYMDPNNPDVQTLAQQIFLSIPESLRTNQTEVAKAVYLWVCRNIDYDLMSRYPGDVTCGNWQTVNGGWRKNFADWCYLPQEVIEEKRAICIEYERFTCTVLRALNIPARPAPLKAHPVSQWWVQLSDGSGYWANMETSKGHILYEQGDTLAYFPSKTEDGIAFWMPNSDAPIHNDWDLAYPCLWREVTDAVRARLEHTPSGLVQAESLLIEFQNKGEIGYSGPPVPDSNYEVYTRGFQVDLSTVGSQKDIIVSFPLFIDNEYNATLNYGLWTNHPEWIESTWVDTLSHSITLETLPMFYAEFKLQPINIKDDSLRNPDFEQGVNLPEHWDTLNPAGISFFSLSNDTFSGSYSAYIRNIGNGVGAFYQTIAVQDSDVIRIDGWLKVAGLDSHALATIDVNFFGDYDNPPPYPGTYPRNLRETQGWTRVWGTYCAPPETDSARVFCTLIGVGEVWFDNLKILVSQGSAPGVEGKTNLQFPKLEANPNPFTSSASIKYSIAKAGQVELKIYNLAGRLVKTLVDEQQKAGIYSVSFDNKDNKGKFLPSGIYFVKLSTRGGAASGGKVGEFSQAKKLLLLR